MIILLNLFHKFVMIESRVVKQFRKGDFMRNMACNLETGVCEVNLDIDVSKFDYVAPTVVDKVRVEYFTDPLCSACFVFEPVIEEFIELYSGKIDFIPVMGGLMPNLTFSEEERSKMADNMEALGEQFNMGVSGKVMREYPVSSSFPPSLAYLAVKKQSESLALIYLRRLREAVYIEEKDISKEAVLVELASELAIDHDQFLVDFYGSEVLDELEYDIAYTVMNGVTGFPSIVIYGLDGTSMIIRSVNDINIFIDAMDRFKIAANEKNKYDTSNVLLTSHYLSDREVASKINAYFSDDFIKEFEVDDNVMTLNVNGSKYFRLKADRNEI